MNADTETTMSAAPTTDAPTSRDKAQYADDDFNWDTWWGGYIDPENE